METPVYPCIWYDGKGKEAAELYCSLFPDSKITSESPVVVAFELSGKKFIALNGGPVFQVNPSISLFVTCDSKEEANRLWNILIQDGSVYIPIDTYPWSEHYGWLQDRFGLTWQISSSGLKDGNYRILPSMLFVGDKFGRVAEAIDFYSGFFAKASTLTMSKYPDGDANAGKTLYSEFSLNGAEIIAMDGPGDHKYTFNEGVSLVIECQNQQEIDHYWSKLSEGGEESMCGWLKDRFGVSWQVVPVQLSQWMNDSEKAASVMESLLKMQKIEIEKLYQP